MKWYFILLIGIAIVIRYGYFLRWIPKFIFYFIKDQIYYFKYGYGFRLYGFKMLCGRQGDGKTMAAMYLLDKWRKKYPKAKIYTNIDYKYQDGRLTGFKDLLEIENGTDGVIFFIDEISSSLSTNAWKYFPEELLSEICQQRKQRKVILATAQVYTRVVKQVREQCYEVMNCRTYGERLSNIVCYDAASYDDYINASNSKKRKIVPKWRRAYVQTEELRTCYDTFEKVKRMSLDGFYDKKNI